MSVSLKAFMLSKTGNGRRFNPIGKCNEGDDLVNATRDALMKYCIQCSPLKAFITHLTITQIWIKYGHAKVPKFFTMEFYKVIVGK